MLHGNLPGQALQESPPECSQTYPWFGQPKRGMFSCYSQVTCSKYLNAATKTQSIDFGYHGLPQIETVGDACEARGGFVMATIGRERFQVCSNTESPFASSRHYCNPQVRVRRVAIEGMR